MHVFPIFNLNAHLDETGVTRENHCFHKGLMIILIFEGIGFTIFFLKKS
jgi:hypothetical protein